MTPNWYHCREQKNFPLNHEGNLLREKSVHGAEYKLLIRQLSEARLGAGISQRAMSALLFRPYTFMQKVESLERQINPVDLLHCCRVLGVDFIEFMTRFEAERSKLPLTGPEANPSIKSGAR